MNESKNRCYFIAEVSSNHGASLDRCIEFVDVAAMSGFDAVKFQAFKVKELFSPEVLAGSDEHRKRSDWELPLAFFPEIRRRCDHRGIALGVTPFYLDAVSSTERYVDFFKIASYEILWLDLIQEVASTGKPLVVSTGMADFPEVSEAVTTATASGCVDLSVLHCVSSYPAPMESINLSAIHTMRTRLGLPIGWSDHTNNDDVILAATQRWRASIVEMHIDLDGLGAESGQGHCWLPDRASSVISKVRLLESMDGNGLKIPAAQETEERRWRSDPFDGLRPLREVRRYLKK